VNVYRDHNTTAANPIPAPRIASNPQTWAGIPRDFDRPPRARFAAAALTGIEESSLEKEK